MLDYNEFLQQKQFVLESNGFDIDCNELNPMAFEYEKDVIRWALAKGRAAVFAGCGLGKTLIQLEWANQVCKHIGEDAKVLILAPLSVSSQTVREGKKFGIDVTLCESQADVQNGINITNYEKLDKFVACEFVGIVLDESSILKSFTGKVRNQIIDAFSSTPFKLACTATPAPNDYMELGNHCEFLGVMTRGEMLAMYFVHDGGSTSKWRLKGHAEDVFWQWMASWAVVMDNPANLGYDDAGYSLPELVLHEIIVDGNEPDLTPMTLTERRNARRESLQDRCKAAADIINKSDEQFIVWCDLNAEQDALEQMIEDNVSVRGATSNKLKIEREEDWRKGKNRTLISKALVFGYGMNWQHCHNVVFVGISDSFEQYYQAVRRCWRFGQSETVHVYIIIASKEGAVKDNIERKEASFKKMQDEMIKLTKEITKKELKKTCRISTPYEPREKLRLPDWEEFKIAS